jgi:sigma54-dependent transcription regulator
MNVLKSAWSQIVADQMEENRDKALRRQKEMEKVKTLQDIINDFVKNIDLMDIAQLEAIEHVISVELRERNESA